MNPYRTNLTVPATTTPRASIRRIYPKHMIMLRRAAGASVFALYTIATPAIETGCGASPTPAQLQQTLADGEQLATCILATVLSGVTDPLVLAQKCGGALPAIIADVISDFETKQLTLASEDAGVSPTPNGQPLQTLLRRKMSDTEEQLLAEAKHRAVELYAANRAAAHKP